MLLNLKALNESFEKKYTLNENENSSPYMVEFLYDDYDDRTDICDENLRGYLKIEADSPEQAIEAARQYCSHYGYHNGSNFGFFKISDDNYTNVKVINAHELLGESLTESAKLNEKFDDSSIEKYDDYKERCADCFALVEVDNQWFCDEAQNFCELVECCPEGMGCLIESLSLNEKFSDSMPSWLKKRLGYTIGYNDAQHLDTWRATSAQLNKMNRKYPNASIPYAKVPRGYNSYDSYYTLGPQFLKAGIDLNKVDVIEAPIPSKVPRTTKNQQFIPIFAFANGQVWAKGINDREEAQYNAIPGYGYEAFGRIPNSEIINNAVAYAYIDLSAKGATDKIHKQRDDLKAELMDLPEIERGIPGANTYIDSDSKGRSIGQWVGRDKSGYLKINAARYADIAKQLAQNKKYKRLPYLIDECSEKLDYYKQQLTMVLDDIDFSDFDSSNSILERLKNSIGKFNEANSYFDSMKKNLDRIENISNIAGEDVSFADKALRKAESCYNELKEVEDALGYLFKEVADW